MSTPVPTPFFFDPLDAPAEPAILRAGDSWMWTRVFGDYAPADGWTLQYVLNSPGGALFRFPDGSISAAADPSQGFAISVTSAQTSSLAPGEYELYAVLSNASLGQQQTIKLQSVTVSANIAGASTSVDTRSFARKTLDVLEAAIAGDSSPRVQMYEIHGRKVQYINPLELLKLREQFKLEVRQEKIASGEYVPKRSARITF